MALPLLALGARLAASQGARAGATQAIRGGATKRTAAAGGGGGIGFMDMMNMKSDASNVIDFKTGRTAENTKGMSMGGGAPAIVTNPTPQKTTSVAGDIQAATELSMDELAKQTKILQDIQENTQQTATNTQSMVGSGAAAAIPSTPGGQDGGSSQKGISDKILAKLSAMAPAASIGVGGLAGFGLAQIGQGKPEDKRVEQAYDITEADAGFFDRIGANMALSDMFGTRRGIDTVSSEELEANQAKREQIVERIQRAELGEDEEERQIALLDKYFKRGQADKVQDISEQYRLAGDKESIAYQYRYGKMDLSEAEKYAETSGDNLALQELETARQTGESDRIAKAEQELVDAMNKKRLEFDKMFSTQADQLGQYGLDTGKERAADQLERAEDIVAAKFGNEGFFGGLMESGKRFFSSEETDQESIERGVRGKLDRIRSNMKASNATEKQIQTRIGDELKNIQQMDVNELQNYVKTDETSTEKLTNQMEQGEQLNAQMEAEKLAAMKSSSQAASTPAGQVATPQEPVVATAVMTDPTTKDSVGNMLKKLNDVKSLSAM